MAELLQVDCEMFGLSSDHYSVTLRRYAGMALTNLTFGDVANKVIEVVLHLFTSGANKISASWCSFSTRPHCAP